MDGWLSLLPDPEKLGEFRFLWDLALILVAVKVAGHLSVRLGQPSIFGKLLVGLILGPALLHWLEPTPVILELAEVGVILLMFLAGLETDVDDFVRAAGPATLVALGGVALPFAGGVLVAQAFGYNLLHGLFIGALLTATSVSISVQTLRELGRLRSREGVTILAAAVLDDILGLVVLSLVLALATAGGEAAGAGAAGVGVLLVRVVLFFLFALLAGRYLLHPAVHLAARLRVSHPVLTVGVAGALGFAYAAEAFGLAGIVGAYLAGLLLGRTVERVALLEGVEHLGFTFLVPVFFASIGLHADLRAFSGSFVAFTAILTLVAVISKVAGCGLGALAARYPSRAALAVGSGMVARGEVGLITATIGLRRELIDAQVFTAMVVVVLVTTLATPPLLKLVTARALEGAPAVPVPKDETEPA